jgi:uncharacterized protein with PIN domain
MPDATDREKQLTANISALLEHIAVETRPCKACGVQLWFVEHKNGKVAPYGYDATNHFAACTAPERFRKAKS